MTISPSPAEINGRPLIGGFMESASRHGERPALEVDGAAFSYTQLASISAQVATLLRDLPPEERFVGVLAHRSVHAYSGIVAILAAGRAYLPLNPAYPIDRTSYTIDHSETRTLIVGPEATESLVALLNVQERPLRILFHGDASQLSGRVPRHHEIRSIVIDQDARPRLEIAHATVGPDALAYLIYTSGSTGKPKGVPITQAGGVAYARYLSRYLEATEVDRVSQFAELTFDFSVHDLFIAWEVGACLCVVPKSALIAPFRFVRDQRLTMWASVPSVAGVMSQMRLLKPGSLPDMRRAVFCGEPLPARLAQQWCDAAPNGFLDNLYGPTEATVAITHYRWNPETSPGECIDGIVPLGWPFTGQEAAVISRSNGENEAKRVGELGLRGSQVTPGYWKDPGRNAATFRVVPELGPGAWYRTGDLAFEGPSGCLFYVGRVDHQVKVRGHRVELQEIEHVLRDTAKSLFVACLAYPIHDGSADALVAFVSNTTVTSEELIAACRKQLPDYMVPAKIHLIKDMPVSANAKIDRLKLTEWLDGGTL